MKKSPALNQNKPVVIFVALSAFALIQSPLVYAQENQEASSTSKTSSLLDFLDIGFSGRLQLDYTDSHADNADVNFNDFEVRRAYLGVDGRFSKRVSWGVTGRIDDTGDVSLVDAVIEWDPKGSDFSFTAGHFKTPMSLDESTSSRFSSTLERAAFTDTVEIDRRLGLGLSHSGDHHTFSAGVFGGSLERQPFAGGLVVSGRATYSPVSNKENTVHFGASARYRTNNKDDGLLRYRQRPYAHITDRIISTGRIADSDIFLGGEAAFIHKNLWAAGEYTVTMSDCPACLSDPSFSGYYIEAGAFLGGRRVYKGGKFNRPKVRKPITEGGFGAVSVVARYDGVDLVSKDTNGGDLETITLGVDWWPTDHTRASLNWFQSDATLGNRGSGLGVDFIALQTAGISDEKVDGFMVRVQFDF